MADAELAEYNAYSDYLNAELAAGRVPFATAATPPTDAEREADARARRGISGGAGGGRGEEPGASPLQSPLCPRGGSETRHPALGTAALFPAAPGRPFPFAGVD